MSAAPVYKRGPANQKGLDDMGRSLNNHGPKLKNNYSNIILQAHPYNYYESVYEALAFFLILLKFVKYHASLCVHFTRSIQKLPRQILVQLMYM